MSTQRPWARTYRQDPVTAELLAKNVVIPHHEDLHDETRGFLDPPFKKPLGPINTELLGMHHYTVHVRIGICRDFLNDLESTLSSGHFNLLTGPVLSVAKMLGGFFGYLLGAYDNLTHELNIVYHMTLGVRAGHRQL